MSGEQSSSSLPESGAVSAASSDSEPHEHEWAEFGAVALELRGEFFSVSFDSEEGCFLVTHPRWSLAGVGEDFGSALADLWEEAQALAVAMLPMEPAQMLESAAELRRYVLQFYTARVG